jgi:hypothetical protein
MAHGKISRVFHSSAGLSTLGRRWDSYTDTLSKSVGAKLRGEFVFHNLAAREDVGDGWKRPRPK